jgi:hypothetical protein
MRVAGGWGDTMYFEYHMELLILGTGRKPERGMKAAALKL